MTSRDAFIGGRYRLGRREHALGDTDRYAAVDEQLDRPVLVWVAEDEGDILLAVAAAAAAAAHPALLRVLDVVEEDGATAVVLEALRSRSTSASDVTAEAAARLALGLSEATEALEPEGVRLQRAHFDDLAADEDGELRGDPIALFMPDPAEQRPAAPAQLLARLLDELLEHSDDRSPLADRLRGIASSRATQGPESGFALMLDAVRSAVRPTRAAFASFTPGDVDDGDLDDREPYIEDEPTAVLDLDHDRSGARGGAATLAPPSPAQAPVRSSSREVPAPERRAPEPRAPALRPREPRRAATSPTPPSRALPWGVFIPVAATLSAVVLGAALFAMRPSDPQQQAPAANAQNPQPQTGAPATRPAAGRVTIGLAATEDANVRVTVDNVVQFDGVLKTGDRKAWEGGQRIQVWTDKGRSVNIAVNGRDLGPYSPAMGHPDWNRIDFGFWPGWGQ